MSYTRRDLPLNALRAFEAVARSSSFTTAARTLNIAQSAVSRHIARLEEIAGQPLFFRTSSGVRLTAAGERLLPTVGRSFEGLSEALAEVQAKRRLRLHVPPAFVQAVDLPLIREFRALQPEIEISVLTTYGIGPPEGGVDIAVTFDSTSATEEARLLLWEISLTPVCTIEDAPRLAEIGLEAALRTEPLLHVQLPDHPADHLWRQFASAAGVDKIRPAGLAFETAALAVDFARAGAGLALADTLSIPRETAHGGLANPFNTVAPSGFSYYLMVAEHAVSRNGVAPIVDHIRRVAALAKRAEEQSADDNAAA